MATIEDILSQRSDLSTFLVHLTKTNRDTPALEVLKKILKEQELRAGNPFGQAVKKLQEANIPTNSQACVCFTETPLMHLRLLLGDIDDRQINLQPYGIALPKKFGRRESVNPVWYLDMTPGAPGWLTEPFDKIIEEAIANHANVSFDKHPVANLAPFVEQMGTWPTGRKEFWWEREWRKLGNFRLPQRIIVIAPEDHHDSLRDYIDALEIYGPRTRLIDAFWSLEQIIGGLAGFRSEDLGL